MGSRKINVTNARTKKNLADIDRFSPARCVPMTMEGIWNGKKVVENPTTCIMMTVFRGRPEANDKLSEIGVITAGKPGSVVMIPVRE